MIIPTTAANAKEPEVSFILGWSIFLSETTVATAPSAYMAKINKPPTMIIK